MLGDEDRKDQDQSRSIAIVLICLVVVLGLAVLLLLPALSGFVEVHLDSGVGLKASAIISFFVTVSVMVVFAVAAGDGLLGEIQFMLGSFFLFFVIFWLLIAWIF